MKHLLALIALLLPTLGVLPGPIWVGDFDADGDVDGADIKLAIDSCRDGYAAGDGGCTVQLEAKTYSLTSTLLWGEGAGNSDSLNSVTLRGMAPCTVASSPLAIGGGTVLKWDGADGGTVIEVERAFKGAIKNLCIVTDPDLAKATGNEALYGLYFDGDAATSKFTQGFVLVDVHFWGSLTGTPTAGSAGAYITGTGTPKAAQNDKMVWERVYTEGLDIGIKQDALQALLNVCRSCSLFGYTSAAYVSGGSWHFRDSIGGFRRATDGILFNFDYQASAGHQQTVIDNWYWESGATACGTLIRIGQGYSVGNTTYGSNQPILVRAGYFNNQTTAACTQKFVDGSIQGGISVESVNFNLQGHTNNCFSVQVSNPTSQPHGKFVWHGNFPTPWRYGSTGTPAFCTVSKVGDITWEAYTTSETGVVFNDLDLDGIQDAGEPAF